ncbi:uncharacterized protein LOC132631959 isoform X1 [Lycium barbarum]|uniref:uncharacterized protein LOC132631959 isoform X1 n=1 Tax=Lycium barbarum TaxID=112863 RepID=UPI00293E34F3|nr:uncharacterized protein LOC132631959 isoform X1 [Lycium barbarum]XP_060203706.1 uncharacterized protein LOC132631959 isoform X1 [Lycium barbarum]
MIRVKPLTGSCSCHDSLKSTSELFNKRNKRAESLCKTCGGSNMLSTVGLEVAKSINPELSWKAVTKGRRSRKAVARRLNEGVKVVNRSPKRVGDFSGSDSDKQIGEAGCWSSDKVEHVPIKKRRHLLQTSSAHSQNPSMDREDSLSPQSLATPMPSEDFSGIALLADAACINDMDDDLDEAKEAHAMIACAVPVGSAGSTPHSKEILVSKESRDPGRGDMVHASITEASIVNESAVAPKGFAEFKEPSVVNRPVSPKVDRMHWDLNTLMDTWEQPPKDSSMENAFAEGLNDGAQKEKLKMEISDKKRNFEDYKHSLGECAPPGKSGAISEFASVKAEVCKLESASVNERIFGEEMFSGNPVSHCTKALDSLSAQRETLGELVTGDALADSSIVKSHNASCMLVSNGLTTTAADGLILTEITDSSVKAAGFSKAALSEVPFPAKPGCESASKCIDRSDPIMTSEVSETSILNAMDVESSDSNPTETDFCDHSSKCEDLSASKVSIAEGQSVAVEPVEQHGNILAIDSRMQLEGNGVISKSSGSSNCDQVEKCTTSGKDSSRSCNEGLQIDDPSQFTKSASAFEDSHKSDISQEDSQMINRDHVTRIEAGYDSPFEDGELRGSIMYSWEDNEIEDGENECVDYELDVRDDMDSDAGDFPASEIVEAGSEGSQSIEKRISSTSGYPEVDFVKGRSPRNFMRRQFNRADNSGGKNGLVTGSRSMTQRFSDKIGGKESDFRKGHTSDCMATYEFRGSYIEEIGSKTNRGKLQSHIEGPHRNRPYNLTGSYHRPVRGFTPDKFVGRYRSRYNSQDRGATDGQWNSWNSRNRHPSTYHCSESHNYSRRHNFTGSAEKFGGLNSRVHQQSIKFSSEGVRRPLVRRRSSVERDDYYDVHNRMVPARGGYQSRNGGRSFSQRVVRGIRDEGYEPIPGDGDLSSVRVPQYLHRRGRTSTPTSGRATHISLPRRRSHSRSRTPSPHPWHTRRERNFSTRRRSRSPDLRSHGRTERSFGEDFSSPQQGHCPAERSSSRWIDVRSFGGEQSKNKWSRKNN